MLPMIAVGAFHKMPDIPQVHAAILPATWSLHQFRIQNRLCVAVGIFVDIKQGTIWSGIRTHEVGLRTRCFNHLAILPLLLVPF